MALTKRQKEFLDFLAGFLEKNGYCPSYEEIADGLSLASLATVHKHILALETKHYLKRGFNQSRSLEIATQVLRRAAPASAGAAATGDPAAGPDRRGRAGGIDGRERHASASPTSPRDPNTYALQVRGESMVEDHICDGDYVLVERAATARDGEIVVALVDGTETTLKRFYKEPGDRVRLQPANATMQPIYVPASSVAIQGKVLAVLRRY